MLPLIFPLVLIVHTMLWLHKEDDSNLLNQSMMDLPAQSSGNSEEEATIYKNHSTFNVDNRHSCTCVDCEEDQVCGGLWRGNRYQDMPSEEEAIHLKIHIVVSHCKKSLDWFPTYVEGFTNVVSIHVISKCGQEAEINNATTIVLPNVGREGHAFAYYISHILPDLVTDKSENSVVVFLKDTTMIEKKPFQRIDLKSIVRLASSSNGFACSLTYENAGRSVYHDVTTLQSFTIDKYEKGERDYNKKGVDVPFKSDHNDLDLGDFHGSLNASPIPDLVQVCFGGVFAASTNNIFKQEMSVWRTLENSLERGDNVEEGHYAERIWGSLLATPLKPFQIEALRNHSKSMWTGCCLNGALQS